MRRRKPLPSTVPATKPPPRRKVGASPRGTPSSARPKPAASVRRKLLPKRDVARIIDDDEKSLVDVLDSLLNQGVVLNADLILALADVDLVYVRLSALLCAADRVLPRKDA